MIVGRLEAEAIGAVDIGSTFFFTAAVFGVGMLLGLDIVVAQAFGAGRLDDGHRVLVQGGLYLVVPPGAARSEKFGERISDVPTRERPGFSNPRFPPRDPLRFEKPGPSTRVRSARRSVARCSAGSRPAGRTSDRP